MNWTGRLRFSWFRLSKVSLKDKLREMESLTFPCANCSNFPVLIADPNLKYYLILSSTASQFVAKAVLGLLITHRLLRFWFVATTPTNTFRRLLHQLKLNPKEQQQSASTVSGHFVNKISKDALLFCTGLDTTEPVEIIAIIILLYISYFRTLVGSGGHFHAKMTSMVMLCWDIPIFHTSIINQ